MLAFVLAIKSELADWVTSFDSSVYTFIAGFISDGMTRFMKMLTFMGSALALVSIAAAFLLASLKCRKLAVYSILIGINLGAQALVNYLLKALFHRPRPELLRLIEESGYSFPSGHSMAAISFYGLLIYFALRYFKRGNGILIAGILGPLILGIGLSRIYLGVHYASDVLAGFVCGFFWLILFIRLSRKYMRKTAS